MDTGDLEGKVVLVTGGSRGIGREIVIGALERGARVALCARELGPEVRELEDEANRLNAGRLLAVRGDVSREPDVAAFFQATIASFDRIDIVVNNAGIIHDDLLISMPVDQWDAVIAVNLTGAFLVSRRAVQVFLSQGTPGRIVSISSVAHNGANSNAGYSTSKGGLVGLMRSIAEEYGPAGIRAYTVAAGFVNTRLTSQVPPGVRQSLVEFSPQGRAGTGREIAAVVLFLASDRAAISNGAVVHASGGLIDAPRYVAAEKVA